jgi:hypothetical protein
VRNTIRLFIPVDAVHNTHNDREEILVHRDFLEVEYKGDNLLYNDINEPK